jgi:hypothetical protein
MEKITRESFTAAMKQVVELRGRDWVYPEELRDGGCQYYVEDYGPACLIGAALDVLGVDVRSLTNPVIASSVLYDLGCADYALENAADKAQRIQDSDGTWGESLDRYLEALGVEE